MQGGPGRAASKSPLGRQKKRPGGAAGGLKPGVEAFPRELEAEVSEVVDLGANMVARLTFVRHAKLCRCTSILQLITNGRRSLSSILFESGSLETCFAHLMLLFQAAIIRT